jgi:hypothetical protein
MCPWLYHWTVQRQIIDDEAMTAGWKGVEETFVR